MISGKLAKSNSPFLLAILIVLVALAAFGLGRLSATGSVRGSLIIHEPGEPAATTP